MDIPILKLPRAVPQLPDRPPQDNIPQTRAERERLKHLVERHVETNRDRFAPPLVLDELRNLSYELIQLHNIDPKFRDYLAVLLNSEVWREQLATVPFERRLLLLPKCLRVEDKCPAPFDEFGLLCKQCGLCSIQDLQEEAERLGYAVLVAEGSAIVMAMIQTGKVEALIGVSCLSVLEKAFPYMEAAAIPGVAVPLLQDDCKDTNIDIEWVWDVIHSTSDDKTRRMDLDGLRRDVETWFESAALDGIFGAPASCETEKIARSWLAKAGKRWRPFLTVCAWRALTEDQDAPLPDDLRKLAVAVECFHKASLIHDDIEDGDDTRYSEPTLHAEHGIPIALNVGDLLIGEGYRLIAECAAPAAVRGRLVQIAAQGHRTLCLGQGAELEWMRAPQPLSSLDVLSIFRQKTAPAFEVALQIGATYAGADESILKTLSLYSEALGIAYQIRDDLDDLASEHAPDDITALRPSLPLALAYERAKGDDKTSVEKAWRPSGRIDHHPEVLRRLLTELGVEERCRQLLDAYKEEAIRTLPRLQNASLKGLLRRVIGKIFTVEIKGWCSEFETRNAAGREAVTETAR